MGVSAERTQGPSRYCWLLPHSFLAGAGIGLAATGAPTIVEAGAVVEKFHKRNPESFGDKGPYAQLYGMTSITFNLGLALGPIVAGGLKETIGYADMNLVLSVLAAATALSCFIWLGGRPRLLWKKQNEPE